MRSSILYLATVSLGALSVAPVAMAADEVVPQEAQAEDSAGEIVVTAQRRAERLQNVPVAVAVASGEQLSNQRVSQLSELSRSLAAVQFSPTPGGSGGGAYIRGVGTFARTRAAEPSVGIVVDGVVQGLVNTAQLSDIARVELLRGPQGTLFGQSVSAGVLNITTNAPDPTKVEGFLETELSADNFAGSRFGRQLVRGAVNVPGSETSAVRFNFYGVRTNGTMHNNYTGEKDEQEEAGFRARYLQQIGEKVTVNLIADYGYDRLSNGGFLNYYYVPAGTRTEALLAQCGVKASINNFEHCSDATQRQLNRTYGFSGQIDAELGSFTATSITAYRRKTSQTRNDIDRLPEDLGTRQQASGSDTTYDQFTQEVRLASDPSQPFSFTVGAFYRKGTVDNGQGPDQQAGGASYNARAGLGGAAIVRNQVQQYQSDVSESYSGFGEARLNLGQFTAFGGLRYTDLKLEHWDTRRVILPALGALIRYDEDFNDKDVSWRGGVQFRPSNQVMIFATVARGYKAAQIMPITTGTRGSVVMPEKPTNYELGVKTNLLNNRLSFNFNGFYTRVKDYQATNCVPDPVTEVPVCAAVNIPRVVSKGLEAELFGRVSRNFTLNVSGTYNVVRYPGNYFATDGVSLQGQQLENAPRYRVVTSANYRIPLNDSLDAVLNVDANYKSKTRLGTNSGRDLEVYKGRTIFSASAGVQVTDSWKLTLFVDNITNERDPVSFGQVPSQLRDPAQINFGVLQSGASLRRVGLQGRVTF